MQKINAFEHHRTSLSLREKSCRRVAAARKILARNGIRMSESELLSRLAKEYLLRWRGQGKKSATARRYNASAGLFRVRPWYVDRVLYSLLWERAIHSGESVSRIVDFAVQHYLPRLLELLLRNPLPRNRRSMKNAQYWRQRADSRPAQQAEVFINYQCRTYLNHAGHLSYVQTCTHIPKKGLGLAEIRHWNTHAA
jgi:hypothetical protein